MDNFRIIYRILKALERAMDCEESDISVISAEKLKISENRWTRLMGLLSDEGYIKGISIRRSVDGMIFSSISNPGITLKGLEYLEENSLMKKAANLAKGISEMIP